MSSKGPIDIATLASAVQALATQVAVLQQGSVRGVSGGEESKGVASPTVKALCVESGGDNHRGGEVEGVGVVASGGSGAVGGCGVVLTPEESTVGTVESGDSDGGGSSWSDCVQEEIEGDSGGTAPENNAGARTYSEVAAAFGGGDLGKEVKNNFFRTQVKVPKVAELRAFLGKVTRQVFPKRGSGELALATHSAATVPAEFVKGRERLKGLSAVGAAAMTLVLVNAEFGKGVPVMSPQQLRDKYLTAAFLQSAGQKKGVFKYISFAEAVDPGATKAGSEAIEALAGVLYRWRPVGALVEFMRFLDCPV